MLHPPSPQLIVFWALTFFVGPSLGYGPNELSLIGNSISEVECWTLCNYLAQRMWDPIEAATQMTKIGGHANGYRCLSALEFWESNLLPETRIKLNKDLSYGSELMERGLRFIRRSDVVKLLQDQVELTVLVNVEPVQIQTNYLPAIPVSLSPVPSAPSAQAVDGRVVPQRTTDIGQTRVRSVHPNVKDYRLRRRNITSTYATILKYFVIGLMALLVLLFFLGILYAFMRHRAEQSGSEQRHYFEMPMERMYTSLETIHEVPTRERKTVGGGDSRSKLPEPIKHSTWLDRNANLVQMDSNGNVIKSVPPPAQGDHLDAIDLNFNPNVSKRYEAYS